MARKNSAGGVLLTTALASSCALLLLLSSGSSPSSALGSSALKPAANKPSLFSPHMTRGGRRFQRRAGQRVHCYEGGETSEGADLLAGRRSAALGLFTTGTLAVMGIPSSARAAVLCDEDCSSKLANIPMQSSPTGLKYQDIVVGEGQAPPKAFDVVVHYTLKVQTPDGQLKDFFSSLEGQGRPLDIRVGTGMVIPGLDEGLATMKKGGVRRLYIPGNLAFPNGVKAKPGTPSVPPRSPIVADVQLIYIPGLDDDLVIAGGDDDATAED